MIAGAAGRTNERQHEQVQRGGLPHDDWYVAKEACRGGEFGGSISSHLHLVSYVNP